MVCGSEARAQTGLSTPFVRGRREGRVDGIRVIELELGYSNYLSLRERALVFFRYALSSVQIALSEKADLIFATSTPLTAGIPGIVARWLKGAPFVFEVRDLWPELPRAMGVVRNPAVLLGMSILEWVSYRSAVACVGLAPGIVEGITARGVPGDRAAMIPNGCDLDLFTPAGSSARDLDGIGGEDFVALFCGAHGKANGLDAVLDAASELRGRGRSDIKLLFVGDGKEKPALLRRAAEQHLSNCIFMPPVSKQRMAEIMSQVNVGLMILDNVPAFYRGTSPNKFFDYISAGLPVLNNYPGWLAELIEEHGCGIAVPPGNPEAFAEALIRLADDPGLASEMGKASRRLAEKHFNRAVLAERFGDWLEQALGDHRLTMKESRGRCISGVSRRGEWNGLEQRGRV
jgi:glycosyltransferase involved in cell wall biosynthesis